MMIVDSNVWINFFNNNLTNEVNILIDAMTNDDNIAYSGVILTEVLQGFRHDKDYESAKTIFEDFTFLEMAKTDFILSARIYRQLRKKGITIRKPIDCMIAAISLNNDIPLLHNDRDFDPIQQHFGLKVMDFMA